MDISITIIKLIIFATPGTISLFLIQKLTGQKPKTNFQTIIVLTALSIPSYLISGYILHKINGSSSLQLLELFSTEANQIPWNQILLPSLISIPLGYILAFIDNKYWINKIGARLKITKRYGDNDIWSYFHNKLNPTTEWLIIRDHKLNIFYFGWISLFSESDKNRELLILDAEVYDNISGSFLYKRKSIYLCRDKFDLTIETPPSGEHE
ncbi:MAG: hypothetical protein EXS67_05175 [Candidatus Margulisbacteria bacterium]|nr:hypothetical protein [Candidatus Margulisiibacteriota bacterium]